MARKVMAVCIALAVVLSVAAPARAATASIYEGTISTSMLEYFSDILVKVSPLKNYVLLRSSQYVYILYVGEFSWDGSSFSCASSDAYTITTNSGYNSHYTFNVSTLSDLVIVPGDYLVYSDLGHFPSLRDSSEVWGFFLSVVLFIMVFGRIFCIIFRRFL